MSTTIEYGLPHDQYIAVCRMVEHERQSLYREHLEIYGPGIYPTVAEVRERCERARETLIFAFKSLNAAKVNRIDDYREWWRAIDAAAESSALTVPFEADDAFFPSAAEATA